MTDREAFEAWLAPLRGQICPPHPEDYLQVWRAALAYERAKQAEPVAWPKGLRDRLLAAHERFINGHAPRRIPADPTDADLVIAEVRNLLDGNEPPFWVAGLPREPLYAAPPADDEAVRLLTEVAETVPNMSIELEQAINAYLAKVKK